MPHHLVGLSKFVSWVLRHEPSAIDLQLDPHGWANVTELIDAANRDGQQLTRELLDEVVTTSDKKRFEFDKDKNRIRAIHGHSIDVDLGLAPVQPPEFLLHGTARRSIESILQYGLHSGLRQFIHLSVNELTANQVAQRHGVPAIMRIRAGEMYRAGFVFHMTANGVWLTKDVPVEYIEFPVWREK